MVKQKQDLHSSDAGFMYSDVVFINHRPSVLGMRFYGDSKTPISENDLFWHLLKNRNGELAILRMIAEFKHMKIEEYVS